MVHPLCALLHLIPFGRVASYGEVARLLGLIHGIKTSGWMVGRVLSGLPREKWDSVPWRRVVAQNGQIVAHKIGEKGIIQEEKLIAE